MDWLDRLLGRKPPAPLAPEVSAKLLAALDERRFDQILPLLRDWCIVAGPITDAGVLTPLAVERGWTDQEIEKLEILVEYYGGDVKRAFERARPFVVGEKFDPDLFVLWLVVLFSANQFEDADRVLTQVDANIPSLADRSDYWMMRALICFTVNDLPRTKEAMDRAYALAPDDQTVLENACGIYLEFGDKQKFDEVRTKLDGNGRPHGYAYALTTLAQGDYRRGFRQAEARYESQEAHRLFHRPAMAAPRWKGQPVGGGTLLVVTEQGLGDSIQMARYLPALKAKVPNLVVEVRPEVLALFVANFPDIDFVSWRAGKPAVADFDYWTGMMSLPCLLEDVIEDVPGRAGYLRTTADGAAYWRQRVDELAPRKVRPRIGIAWSGHPAHRSDRRRSIPVADLLEAIADVSADFFALQLNVAQSCRGRIRDLTEELVTLSDTAALVEQLDLVISVDTSVVHVAGALAKETWLLLPYRYEWRWGFEGEDNRWYDSVRVLRQSRHSDWNGLLETVFRRRLPQWQSLRSGGK